MPVYAESVVVSKELQMIYFSDGSELKVEVAAETVKITGTHIKSESRYSYVTDGFNVSLEKTEGMVEEQNFRTIKLLEKTETITNQVTTTYILDRDSIYEAVFALFKEQNANLTEEEISKSFLQQLYNENGIEFYLHNAFRVIERTGGSGTDIISASKLYHSLGTPVSETGNRIPGILNAIDELYGLEWSAATEAKLREYYDIHLWLFMEPSLANIYMVSEDGEILRQVERNYPIAQYARINYRLPISCYESVERNGKKYQLTENSIRKSYVCYGSSKQALQTYAPGAENGLNVQLGTLKLSYKQLLPEISNVYLVCEQMIEPEKPEQETKEWTHSIIIDCFMPTAEMELKAETAKAPRFDVGVEGGIPVNEELCIDGEISGYLIKAEFVFHEGKKLLWIPVEKTYELRWTEPAGYGEDEPFLEEFVYEKTIHEYVPVEREYSYISLERLEYYVLDQLMLENTALPFGGFYWSQQQLGFSTGVAPLSYNRYGGLEAHIVLPEKVETGICLPKEIIYGENEMPDIPKEDFKAIAEEELEELLVRDDEFWFNQKAYLSSELQSQETRNTAERETELLTLQKKKLTGLVLERNVLIPETVKNGIHYSDMKAVYRKCASTHDVYPEKMYFSFEEVNPIYIHTPVYCEGLLETDNSQYCQRVVPNSESECMVLDAEGISGDFFVNISNYGMHKSEPGYGTRDYSIAFSNPERSYIAECNGKLRNEVCFPFDVFWDCETDYDVGNDMFFTAGQWIVIGTIKERFYLPEWVQEGQYEVQYRTVAVNGEEYTKQREEQANLCAENYVAVDCSQVEVSGKLFGFQIYDIADYPAWEKLFRNADGKPSGEVYTVGNCDEYGRTEQETTKQTLPIMSGSHPYLPKAYIKPGYLFRFSMDTIGSSMAKEGSYIRIIPRFFHVDETGNNRREVDLYYCRRKKNGNISLMRIGSEQDKQYGIYQTVGSAALGIPDRELEITAELKQLQPEEYRAQEAEMYSYGYLEGKSCFKTFCNFDYVNNILKHGEWDKILTSGIAEKELHLLCQRHYFEYALPFDVMAVYAEYPVEAYAAERGVNFTEDFWIKDGYLIVQFDITAYVDGTAYLSYTNEENRENGYCNMWIKEHMPSEKTDGNGKLFYFEPGDIFCFPVNRSIQQDYSPGGIY